MADIVRILYVDDEPDLLEIARHFLEREGAFTVDTLTSAQEAIVHLNTARYDAIVSDYQMPGMDGITFLKQLKESGNPTPFIIFTGRGREEVVIEALNNGADFYIQKGGEPLSQFTELSNKIRYAVARRRTEEALRESEVQFRGITERISDLIIVMDPEGHTTFMSPSVTRILGFPPEWYLGKKADEDFIPAEDVAKTELAIEKLKNGSLAEQVEFRIKKSNGSYAVFEGTGIPVFRDGIYRGVQVVARDITGRQKNMDQLRAAYEQLAAAEEELRGQYDSLALNEAEWESTFNAISDWIALITPEGQILHTNRAAESLFGKSAGQVAGMNCFELVHGTECLNHDCPRKRMLVSKTRESIEIPKRDGNGWLQVTVDPILSSSGEVRRAVHIVRDITERTRSQKALEQAKKKLTLLNYVTFNDIQNLIFTLSGYQHLVKERVKDHPASSIIGRQEEVLQKISHSLKFAQSYQDLGLKPSKWQNANQVFLLAISHLDFLMIQHTVELNGLEIFADPLLEQVFQILADNTLVHGKTATRVSFRYSEGQESVKLLFEDNGVGVPEDAKIRIFLPDFQKKKGVGLFLAREILDITGITICETGEPGKGARFEIVVPKGMWRLGGK